MRVSKVQAADSRERILDAAARLFRERGFAGTGVDAVTKAAGLTHGAFYGHFASKDELMAAACTRSLGRSLERWTKPARGSEEAFDAIVAHYLSAGHRDRPGEGCLMAALASETARGSEQVRKAFTEGVRPLVEVLAANAAGADEEEKRKTALCALATLVGAIVLARAVDDPALSDEILQAAAGHLRREGDRPPATTSPHRTPNGSST